MRLESLEGRRLLAVTVSEGYPGTYEVRGDDGGNHIDISVSQKDGTFTLDGTTYTGVSFISVIGGAGKDVISVLSSDGPGAIAASIDAGGGDDCLALNFDGGIWAGDGNDYIFLIDSFRGVVDAGAGNDTVYVNHACIDAEISGGDGDDLIDASSNYYSVTLHGGAGNDTLYGSDHDDQIYGDDGNNVIYGGLGNDEIFAQNGSVDTVDGGDGQDTVWADAGDVNTGIETVHIG